jgi:NAD+ kinase
MKLGIVINRDKARAAESVMELCNAMDQRGIEVCINRDAATLIKGSCPARPVDMDVLGRDCDFILSFGGDGTLLAAARAVGSYGKPILGVNIGKLGFLTAVETGDLLHAVERLIAGDYRTESRLVLHAQLEGHAPIFALNDLVVIRSDAARMIRIRVDIDGTFLNRYTADGLIVATPTGSTAYSLSANGPILTPSLDALVINPICPHTLTMRPIVVGGTQEIRLHLEDDYTAFLTSDGQEEQRLTGGEIITIRKAAHTIQLVRFPEKDFFDILRGKLHWGEDARTS